jgi:hypothetical protein
VRGRLVELEVANPVAALKHLRGIPGVRQGTLYGTKLHALLEDANEGLLRARLEAAGFPIAAITPVPLAMDDVFAAIVEAAPDVREAAA